jgi:hypothetical protein
MLQNRLNTVWKGSGRATRWDWDGPCAGDRTLNLHGYKDSTSFGFPLSPISSLCHTVTLVTVTRQMNAPPSSHSHSTPPPHLNGVNNDPPPQPTSPVPPPPVDSPTTPVSDSLIPDAKININTQEQVSDARHELIIPVSLDKLDSQSLESTAALGLREFFRYSSRPFFTS